MAINRKSLFNNKKGFFFTFLAILLVSILLIINIKTPALQSQKQTETIKIKVSLINDFTKTLQESYVPRVLYFSATEVLINYTHTEDVSIFQDKSDPKKSTFNAVFAENLSNTILPLLQQIAQLSQSKLNIYSEINMSSFTLVQQNPWQLNVSAKYSIYTRTNDSDVVFNINNEDVSVLLPVEGFDDPLFFRKAKLFSGNETRRQIKTVTNIDWDKETALAFYQQKLYRESSFAPSFLSRVKGDYSASTYGIETFLDPNTYTPNEKGYAQLDYKFFNQLSDCKYKADGSIDVNLYEIKDIQQGFYLDVQHIGFYNLTSYVDGPYNCPAK